MGPGNKAVQKDMTVRAARLARREIGAQVLKVHIHEDHNHCDLRRRGPDRHLPESNRGLRRTSYPVCKQVVI